MGGSDGAVAPQRLERPPLAAADRPHGEVQPLGDARVGGRLVALETEAPPHDAPVRLGEPVDDRSEPGVDQVVLDLGEPAVVRADGTGPGPTALGPDPGTGVLGPLCYRQPSIQPDLAWNSPLRDGEATG